MKAGLKGFEVGAWHGIYAPKGTPDDIVQKLAKTLQEALRDPDLVKRFNDINTEPVPQDQATPGGAEGTIDQRGRSLGADHQGGRSVRGLRHFLKPCGRRLSARRRTAPPHCRCAICAAIFGGNCASHAR